MFNVIPRRLSPRMLAVALIAALGLAAPTAAQAAPAPHSGEVGVCTDWSVVPATTPPPHTYPMPPSDFLRGSGRTAPVPH